MTFAKRTTKPIPDPLLMATSLMALFAGGCFAQGPVPIRCVPMLMATHGERVEQIPLERGSMVMERRCPDTTTAGRREFVALASTLIRSVHLEERRLTDVRSIHTPSGAEWFGRLAQAGGASHEEDEVVASRSFGRGEVCVVFLYVERRP